MHRGPALLPESFEQLHAAAPRDLAAGLAVHFADEEAAGEGVLREWCLLIGREMLAGRLAPFSACPEDRGRFFPALSLVDAQTAYFTTCGRGGVLLLGSGLQC